MIDKYHVDYCSKKQLICFNVRFYPPASVKEKVTILAKLNEMARSKYCEDIIIQYLSQYENGLFVFGNDILIKIDLICQSKKIKKNTLFCQILKDYSRSISDLDIRNATIRLQSIKDLDS